MDAPAGDRSFHTGEATGNLAGSAAAASGVGDMLQNDSAAHVAGE